MQIVFDNDCFWCFRNDNHYGCHFQNSLPTAQLQRSIQKRHIDYDDAHQSTSDCATQFPLCPDSIWTAGFLIDLGAKFITHNDNHSQTLNAK